MLMRYLCMLLVLLVLCRVQAEPESVNSDLVLNKVERGIDVSSHLIKISTSMTIENTGKTTANHFVYVLDPYLQNHEAYVGATLKSEDDKLKVKKKQTTIKGQKNIYYQIDLSSGIEPGKTAVVELEEIYTHALQAYPSQIAQSEKQYVVFSTNLYLFSPYRVISQSAVVTCASSNIEFYTKKKPVSQAETSINYGPYPNKEPFTAEELKVHFENNSPFLTVTYMERVIEISHWGNIAVEEHFQVAHSGATLKGPFSRYDYQRNQDGVSSIKSFKTILPAAARDVYYRDEIGNISTSHLKEMDDSVELELRPRFPLFGGWKTQYYIGYNVPSYEYLYNKGDKYLLKMRLMDHVFDDQIVDHLTVKIILPEGSKNIKLKAPFEVVHGKRQLHFTYLDTIGRPVIVLHKSNLVEQHIQDFELGYSFQKFLLLQEPLLVVGAFYLLFLVVIIYVRLDFSITKDEAKESKMRIASLIEEVQSSHDKRSALYQTYDDATNKFKSNKEASVFQTSRKKIDSDYKQLTQRIHTLQATLKEEGAEAAEKVAELQKLDSQYKELINQAINYAEKLINNKMNKQAYIESEPAISKKRAEINQRMEVLSSSL
ncbi:dolichyl-diphosphooligosaccharide--protein glycosyltransferase subunit 1 [Octopus bimaculoides]|uniref:Dolichyl-diphosphooligosaccharide--protein glycosyltransferase subunit 1 n=1 Tax=Octopus bimaculoides TaxID=37653 RepID=A0A0L8GGA9_OCTBM|nr:dolichyl-diphosphooligosaccharide--protein glycosyltransferase subunit 1 [Octopus bimaculoides]|eukprot:XP_014781334.1 PREDICTED: dolichyl-diphosphooligosaccharide--protein glycosyltransferase subunit 1-like [Octopus bimaculoides]